MKITIAILLALAGVRSVSGLCNTCSATTGLACVGEDKFEVCVDGIPMPPAIQCPDGTVCTPNAQVCSPIGSAPSSCRRCNLCSDSKVFACTDYSSFALCFGSDMPSEIEFRCPTDLVCNIDSPNICVDRRLTGIGATCPEKWTTTAPTELIPSTTPRPENQPNAYCEAKGFPGRYEISSDSNCQSYISCVFVDETWVGNLYECPKATFFNPITQVCGPLKPNRCA